MTRRRGLVLFVLVLTVFVVAAIGHRFMVGYSVSQVWRYLDVADDGPIQPQSGFWMTVLAILVFPGGSQTSLWVIDCAWGLAMALAVLAVAWLLRRREDP